MRPRLGPAATGVKLPRRAALAVAAFTIIELLVAMTVTMLLVVALMQVFNATASTWQHGEAQVDAYREARGALQFMARDLSATLQASYTQTSNTSATAFKPALPTLVLQRSPNTVPDPTGPNNEEIYCLTNIPNSGASTLCAVGYYCQWMPDYLPLSRDGVDRRPQAYALMRQFADSNATFLRIQTATKNGNVPLKFDDLFTRPTSPVQLAAYIWDLRFRIDTDLNDSAPPGVPDGNDPSPTDHGNVLRYRADGGSYPPRLPPYVEIRFKALSDTAGRRLEGPGTGVTKATWKDTDPGFVPSAPYRTIIKPNAQQFVLRVPLINATP